MASTVILPSTLLVVGIIASLKAVRRLEISYGGDAGSINVDFLLWCSRHGVADIFLVRNEIYNDFEDDDCLDAEDVVSFVLAGAVDGEHRKIGFGPDVIDGNALLKLLLKVR